MKAAVICSEGIDDTLLMMVASHRLFAKGYTVSTYQDGLCEMNKWFPSHHLRKRALLHGSEQTLSEYNLVILQYDHSPLAHKIIELYKKGHIHNLSVFYSHYQRDKHPALTSWDRVFDQSKSMVENIATSVASLLQCKQISKNNGLIVPKELKRKQNGKRILIDPIGKTSNNTWKEQKFIKLASMIAEKGYEIAFIVHHVKKRIRWLSLLNGDFLLPTFPTLSHLAAYVYESSLLIAHESDVGHLASNLHIPTLIIPSYPKQVALRRPDWFFAHIVTPPPLACPCRWFCFHKKKEHSFISTKRVFRHFMRIHMDLSY